MARRVGAVIFDGAGTAFDLYCQAPIRAMRETLRQQAVPVSAREAQKHMGLPKRVHLAALMGSVRERWAEVYGRRPDSGDLDDAYATYLEEQRRCIFETSAPLDGFADLHHNLRKRGVRLGLTTGYPREVLDVALEALEGHGVRFDATVACDDAHGCARPSPLMIDHLLGRFEVPPERCVKVGDTVLDVLEADAATVWSVGVAGTSTLIDPEAPDVAAQVRAARGTLCEADPHFVVDTLRQMPEVLARVEAILEGGGTPATGARQCVLPAATGEIPHGC